MLGTLDIERALKSGERRFEPGLLARANRGVLYVDEVNLMPDHLVDVLLDAVAMGVNRIEREGVYPANMAARAVWLVRHSERLTVMLNWKAL